MNPKNKAEEKIISSILYEQSNGISLREILAQVRKINQSDRKKIISIFASLRQNRRQRPPRAFEMTEYTFDFLTNFGMFRDFHRHRVLTLERQLLTTNHGYVVPDEIVQLGIKKDYDDCMYNSKQVFDTFEDKDARTSTVCCKLCIQLSIFYEIKSQRSSTFN